MKIWQILALIGTLVFLFSGALPLISIHFIGVFPISLFDLYRWFGYALSTSEPVSGWTASFSSVEAGFLLTAILFPITLIVGFASLRIGPKSCLVAGFLGIICWLSSLFAIIQLKFLIAQLGGLFGGLAVGFVQIGYGIYVGVLGSVMLLISYFVAAYETKKNCRFFFNHQVDRSN